jgi:Protein of unknown function (DUF2630)
MELNEQSSLHAVQVGIETLEGERQAIYADSHVDERENPRLKLIEHELRRLWDLRRRIEAAHAAGLDHVPVLPPADPDQLTE